MEKKQGTNWWVVVVVIVVLAVLVFCVITACVAGVVLGSAIYKKQSTVRSYVVPRPEQVVPEQDEIPRERPEPRAPLPPWLEHMEGALIVDVRPNSPAAQAGLRPGDLIVAVDNEEINASNTLVDVIMRHSPRDRVTITIRRNMGRELAKVVVRLAPHPDNPDKPYLGVVCRIMPALDFPEG